MSRNALVEFRTAYLRLIARAWIHPKYAKWVVGLSPDELIDHLKADYDFDWPWPALEIQLTGHGAEWEPRRTGGWRGKSFSGQLTVKLPITASCIRGDDMVKLRPLALADFYALRHSVFGQEKPESTALANGRQVLGQGFNSKLGTGEEPFLEFSAVMMRALALAWDDEEFKDHLLNPSSCLPALAGWLGYTSPWNMNIVVQNDYDAFWEEPDVYKHDTPSGAVNKGRANGWQPKNPSPGPNCKGSKQPDTTLSKNQVLLHLPQCPSECDADDKADDSLGIVPIALAAYNQTGPAYPFTCCP